MRLKWLQVRNSGVKVAETENRPGVSSIGGTPLRGLRPAIPGHGLAIRQQSRRRGRPPAGRCRGEDRVVVCPAAIPELAIERPELVRARGLEYRLSENGPDVRPGREAA